MQRKALRGRHTAVEVLTCDRCCDAKDRAGGLSFIEKEREGGLMKELTATSSRAQIDALDVFFSVLGVEPISSCIKWVC
jgi:hypothetical protein